MSHPEGAKQPVMASQPLSGVQILLVEDEPDVAELITYVLEESGASVTLADSAIAALGFLATQQPDVLVSNLRLPDQDGCWLIRQIRKVQDHWNQSLPAIAVTSYTREFANTAVLAAGFHHFMSKPLNPNELIDEILELIGRVE